jgi:hypothetical protein
MLKNSQNASGPKLGFFLWKIPVEAFSGRLSPLPKSRAKPRDLEVGKFSVEDSCQYPKHPSQADSAPNDADLSNSAIGTETCAEKRRLEGSIQCAIFA